MTDYYCEECDEVFSEEKMPNINKRHGCGALARILRSRDEEE